MTTESNSKMDRRLFLGASAAAVSGLAAPALAQDTGETVEIEGEISEVVRRNISSFRSLNWQPYFDSLKNGCCLVDTKSRALHYWSEDESIYKLYPTNMPLTNNLTRLNHTRITQKIKNPS